MIYNIRLETIFAHTLATIRLFHLNVNPITNTIIAPLAELFSLVLQCHYHAHFACGRTVREVTDWYLLWFSRKIFSMLKFRYQKPFLMAAARWTQAALAFGTNPLPQQLVTIYLIVSCTEQKGY